MEYLCTELLTEVCRYFSDLEYLLCRFVSKKWHVACSSQSLNDKEIVLESIGTEKNSFLLYLSYPAWIFDSGYRDKNISLRWIRQGLLRSCQLYVALYGASKVFEDQLYSAVHFSTLAFVDWFCSAHHGEYSLLAANAIEYSRLDILILLIEKKRHDMSNERICKIAIKANCSDLLSLAYQRGFRISTRNLYKCVINNNIYLPTRTKI